MCAGGVTVGHSVTLIHIAHMMVIIHHNLRLYGFSSLIAEITFRWGIMNISQHAYVSLVPPQYGRQVSPGSKANVSPLSSTLSLQIRQKCEKKNACGHSIEFCLL